MAIIWIGIGLAVACFAGWVIGEMRSLQSLRVVCVFLLLLLVTVVPYGLGSFFGAANAYIATSEASSRFFDAAVDQLEAGASEPLYEELRRLNERVRPTYEGSFFVAELNAATERLRSPVAEPLTEEAAKAVEIARQAVAANDDWADQATFHPTRDRDGWVVLVESQPAVPGGHVLIHIDGDGNVVAYSRGR